MTSLREQIEALPAISSASASWDKGGTLHIDTIDQPLLLDRQAVLDIIDAHEQEDAALRGRLAYLEKWKDDRDQDALWAEERHDPS